jgi:hypothetical protein
VVVSDLKNIKGKTDNLGVALEDKTTSADASKIKTGITALNSAFAAAIEKFSWRERCWAIWEIFPMSQLALLVGQNSGTYNFVYFPPETFETTPVKQVNHM